MCLLVSIFSHPMKCPQRPEEGSGSPTPGVTVTCHRCWEPNSGHFRSTASTLHYRAMSHPSDKHIYQQSENSMRMYHNLLDPNFITKNRNYF